MGLGCGTIALMRTVWLDELEAVTVLRGAAAAYKPQTMVGEVLTCQVLLGSRLLLLVI